MRRLKCGMKCVDDEKPFMLPIASINGEKYLKMDTLMEWLVFLAKDNPHAAKTLLLLREALKEISK